MTGAAIAITRIASAMQPQNAENGERLAKLSSPLPIRRSRDGSAARAEVEIRKEKGENRERLVLRNF